MNANHDAYLNFANSALGSRLVSALGLPKPMVLERYREGQSVINGTVLLGGGAAPQLLAALAATLKSIGATGGQGGVAILER